MVTVNALTATAITFSVEFFFRCALVSRQTKFSGTPKTDSATLSFLIFKHKQEILIIAVSKMTTRGRFQRIAFSHW